MSRHRRRTRLQSFRRPLSRRPVRLLAARAAGRAGVLQPRAGLLGGDALRRHQGGVLRPEDLLRQHRPESDQAPCAAGDADAAGRGLQNQAGDVERRSARSHPDPQVHLAGLHAQAHCSARTRGAPAGHPVHRPDRSAGQGGPGAPDVLRPAGAGAVHLSRHAGGGRRTGEDVVAQPADADLGQALGRAADARSERAARVLEIHRGLHPRARGPIPRTTTSGICSASAARTRATCRSTRSPTWSMVC